MAFKPGDILYRRYSDQNDLYCVIIVYQNPFAENLTMVGAFPYYSHSSKELDFVIESEKAVETWYIKVDLNNYEIKDKFLTKIKNYLNEALGKLLFHNLALDNLLYIEILAALKKYETSDTSNDIR